jgi:hypothetical protein
MHPISSKNFGPGKITVRFHNGIELVDGYIIKQIGLTSYVVSDGTVKKNVRLAQSEDLAKLLTGEMSPTNEMPLFLVYDLATLMVAGGYVSKITSKKLVTLTNTSVSWSLDSFIPIPSPSTIPSNALLSPIDGRVLLSPVDGRILLRA